MLVETKNLVLTMGKLLAGVLLVALIARVGTMVALETWVFPSERAFGSEEGEIAYAVVNGQGYSWPQMWRAVGPPGAFMKREAPEATSWKAPVNPLIIAGVFWMLGTYTAGSAIALELFQVGLALLSCYVLFRLGRLVFKSEWAGLLAALVFAVYPASIHFSVQKIEYSPLLTLLGLVFLEQAVLLTKRPRVAKGLFLGFIGGIATLVNPVILAFFPFALAWFLVNCDSEWYSRLKVAMAAVICCVAITTPWLVRNYIVFDQFVFIRSNFARELLVGNFMEAGRAQAGNNTPVVSRDFSGDDGQWSQTFYESAVKLVMERPGRLIGRTVERVRSFWTIVGEGTGSAQVVVGVAYFSVLSVSVAGMWLAWREPEAQLLLIYVLSMPLPFYVTWANRVRFRFPLEPVLILFASYAVVVAVSKMSSYFAKRRHPQLVSTSG